MRGDANGEKGQTRVRNLRENIFVVIRELGGRLEKGAGNLHCSAFLIGVSGHPRESGGLRRMCCVSQTDSGTVWFAPSTALVSAHHSRTLLPLSHPAATGQAVPSRGPRLMRSARTRLRADTPLARARAAAGASPCLYGRSGRAGAPNWHRRRHGWVPRLPRTGGHRGGLRCFPDWKTEARG